MTPNTPAPDPVTHAEIARCLTKIGELEANISAVAAELARRIDTLEHHQRAELDRHRTRLDGIDEYLARADLAAHTHHDQIRTKLAELEASVGRP